MAIKKKKIDLGAAPTTPALWNTPVLESKNETESLLSDGELPVKATDGELLDWLQACARAGLTVAVRWGELAAFTPEGKLKVMAQVYPCPSTDLYKGDMHWLKNAEGWGVRQALEAARKLVNPK